MYNVKALGLNTKDNERIVKDGFLQESINLQWRDNSFRPIPERLASSIDVSGYEKIILNKVSDENQINVLGFKTDAASLGGDLAADLAAYLGGAATSSGYLTWFGKIVDGVYSAVSPQIIPDISNTPGMSFTILNGLVYFMGNGDGASEQYYKRIQYNETSAQYEVKDMYAWKSLVPFYPVQSFTNLTIPKGTFNVGTRCGILLIRFTLVLKSGEEVMHTPIYGMGLSGINISDTAPQKDDLIENIHTFIRLNLEFEDEVLLNQEVSAINIYSTVPYYLTKFPVDVTNNFSSIYAIDDDALSGEFQRLAETPFYLVKTIDPKNRDKYILLSAGEFSAEITYSISDVSKINLSSIAAGEVMPVDNFSHHKVYGKIKSANGRIVIESPTTILSNGYVRALATSQSTQGFESAVLDTEDGNFSTITREVVDTVTFTSNPTAGIDVFCRGMLSYPDGRAEEIRLKGIDAVFSFNWKFPVRRNNLQNMSCLFDMNVIGNGVFNYESGSNAIFSDDYFIRVKHNSTEVVGIYGGGEREGYTSENRAQFSAAGEFSVWPAINSERIGEGKIISIGANNVNPKDADIVAPLIVGTSDGVYTINLDPTGNNFISSVTKTLNIPYVSAETLQIGSAIVFVSDKGLIAINGGDYKNLTKDFFPQQGNGDFPAGETTYPNYNLLTNSYFGGPNPYVLDDVVNYLKGALLAYDGRRNTIWCSNPSENFSLIYSLTDKLWGMSTLVFNEKPELFSTLNTGIGDIYSRFLVKASASSNLLILSGEDYSQEVFYHLLTRPLKMTSADKYKKINRMFSRCELFRNNTGAGYFSFGLWGRQDINKNKQAIPLAIKNDNRTAVYPGDVRQDIPIGYQKGKYKTITILQGGVALPESSLDEFEIDAMLVDEVRIR